MSDTQKIQRPTPPPKDGLVLSGASMALPARFGPYRVEKGLAKGGMGAVLLVRHETLDALYALKVLPDAETTAPHLLRFQREIQALAGLSHPNIVKIHACGIEAGRPWYVMDRIEGEPLDRIVADKGPLSIRAAVRLGAQIASALAAAHARSVLHRDVKPGNILLVGDLEADGRAVLCDFGLATLPGARFTNAGEILGTPAFMAPEQALSEKEKQGPHTDVFALASVLYFALTGTRAFGEHATTVAATLIALLQETLVPPRRRRDEIPPALEAVLVRALEKDPTRRYSTAEDFGAALSSSLTDGRPARAGSARALLAGVVLLVLAALAAVAALVVARKPPPPAPPPTTAPPPPPPPTLTPREELEAAIRAHDLARLATADRRMKEAGGHFSFAENLRAAREVLLEKKPLAAVERAIGDRIPDDPDERAALARLALDAAAKDDKHLAEIAAAAACAGLEVPELAAKLDERTFDLVGKPLPEGDALADRKRGAIAAASLRGPGPADAVARKLDLFVRPPDVPKSVAERIDHEGLVGDKEDMSGAERARLLAREHDLDGAWKALDAARASAPADRVALAEADLAGSKAPAKGLALLGAPSDSEPLATQLLRAKLLVARAKETRDEADERAAVSAYAAIFARARPLVAQPSMHYVATRCSVALADLELTLGARHRARAWLARGRLLLGGGGKAFDELAERAFAP